MHRPIDLTSLLANINDPDQQNATFSMLSLGVTESLVSGSLSASDALRDFFHAENCLYVNKTIRSRSANELMSRGVQLADLFDALPVEQAQQEYQRELAAMHTLCLQLLESERLAA